MGRVHTFSSSTTVTSRRGVLAVARRGLNLVVGTVLLILALPLMAVLALAVRQSSHGPVLQRQRTRDARGRSVELLSFRTTLDGAESTHHSRLRAVVGAADHTAVTGAGRVIRALRAERLPWLLNVVRGDASLI